MKKLLFIALLISLTTFSFTAIHAQDPITVLYNGSKIDFDVAPMMQNDRIMVPVRAIFEKMNAFVLWDEANNRVIAVKNGEYCTLEIGSNILKTGICEGGTPDGKLIETASVEIDVPAAIKNDRTLIPLRAVSQAMRASVDWNGDTNTCTITTTEDQAPDGWFYYASWSDTGKLYKIDSNGNRRQKLVDLDCYNVFYRDGWVYFYTWSNRERLYRVQPNGESLQQLTKERVRIVQDAGEWVYYTALIDIKDVDKDYQTIGTLHRMHWDGSEKQLIAPEIVGDVCFSGDAIYYSGAVVTSAPYYKWKYDIYKVSRDGKDKQQIPNNGHTPQFGRIKLHDTFLYFFEGDFSFGYLYCINLQDYTLNKVTEKMMKGSYYFTEHCILYQSGYELRTVDYKGQNDQCIVNDSPDYIILENLLNSGKIYYITADYSGSKKVPYEFWRCDIDGQNKERLSNSDGYPLIRGDKAFYFGNYNGSYEVGHGLSYTDLDGKNLIAVTEDNIIRNSIQLLNNKIYACTADKKLYRYHMDGSNKTMITNEQTMFFTFAPTGV